MKSLSFMLLSASVLLLCGFGDALTASDGFTQAVPIFGGSVLLAIIAALSGYKIFKREQKVRVLIPIKTQRPEKPTVIRRRRNQL